MPKTILLADDSVTIRKVVELTFSDSEYRVESVESGREAMDRIEALQPDLVMADVVMPGPSGYEVCERVKESGRPVPVLLLAGTFEPFDPERARECGADDHLVKPFESSVLLRKVESLLAPPERAPGEHPPTPSPAPREDELDAVLDDLVGAGADEELPARALGETGTDDAREPEGFSAAAEAARAGPPPGWEAGIEPAPDRAPAGPEVSSAADETAPRLTDEEIDAVARAVVERISTAALREIAWEVVPDLAEVIIRERIRELEQEAED